MTVTKVKIKTSEGTVATLKSGELMLEVAEDWCHKVATRSRWASNPSLRKQLQQAAQESLEWLGIDVKCLKKIAMAGIVEVGIPFDSSITADEAFTMPWEYMLSAATKEYRGEYSLCVVRYLDNKQKMSYASRSPENFGYVETAPGVFSDAYDFTAERELIHSALGDLERVEIPINPTLTQLKGPNGSVPDVIHVSGIDSRLGNELLTKAQTLLNQSPATANEPKNEPQKRAINKKVDDGLYFATSKHEEKLIGFERVARALTGGKEKPQFIGLNCLYSGSRIAPHCVANGAISVIGIQNKLDDRLAERYFVRFYQAWLSNEQDTLAAFIEAWEAVKPLGDITKGTGIILWNGKSIFSRRSKKFIKPTLIDINKIRAKLAQDKVAHRTSACVADPAKDNIRDLVGIKIAPYEVINYCMLHNGQSIVKELYFWFKKVAADTNVHSSEHDPEDSDNKDSNSDATNGDGEHEECRFIDCIRDIEVEVRLKVGSEALSYQTRVSLGNDHPQLDLADNRLNSTEENPSGGIQIPLTSTLLRSIDENTKTNLYVNVEWGGQVLLRHSYAVTLAPVDEWSLAEKDNLLIPSFVQPRDPVIVQVIDSAHKYLQCILEDAAASFNGYQASNIEPQIRAIWCAMLFDHAVGYISPPPSSNRGTQRLRTPSQVIHGRRGTCVDLAILMASCLEYIELYPVIINSGGHAFAGCWSTDTAQAEFMSVTRQTEFSADEEYYSLLQAEHPWVSLNYADIQKAVASNALIPFECIALTWFMLYEGATSFGKGYFGEEDFQPVVCKDGSYMEIGNFESMIDIYSARELVSPLPLSVR